MRSPRPLLALFLPLMLAGLPAVAQDPPKPPTPPASERAAAERAAPPAAATGRERARATRQGPGRRGSRRAPMAIEAGFVHPVSGPVIENGVILIRGNRIVAVGKKGEVEVPEGTATRSFPNGHAYPGLIDARTDAFTDPATAGSTLSHDLAIADGLRPRYTRDDQLAAAGITTAYVAAAGGQGAIVRTTRQGFEVWPDKDHAGLHLRMTRGPAASHPLQRLQQLEGQLKMFDGLDKYEKAKKDYNKALDKYEEEFAAYLEHHAKKKGSGKPAAEKAKPEAPAAKQPDGKPAGERPTGRGRRGGTPGGDKEAEVDRALELLLLALEETATQDPKTPPQGKTPPQPQGKPGAKPTAKPAAKKDEAPKRPAYPKPVKEDPSREALLAVLAGKMPLRVEAHRTDELRAALRFLTEKEVPLLVLEKAYGAAALADEFAKAGAFVVLTDVLPQTLPKPYEDFDPPALPAQLNAAGVPFAIASGTARRAPLLPMMAAIAVGEGLPREAALRAITLTAAEILGIQKETGSLQPGKYADVAVFDRPLFRSDSRVLFVLGRGRTEYEVK